MSWLVKLPGRVARHLVKIMSFTNWLSLTIGLAGLVLLSQGVYMDAKASLAQVLIERTWLQRDTQSPPTKPWWWADTRVVAKLEVPRLDKQVFVMQDDSGESLAFGPGHVSASAPIAEEGHVMIAGHRDSHFTFLNELGVGDVIETTKFDSAVKRYQIKEVYVLDTSKEDLRLYESNQLTLITCYPFDSVIPGGPLRYVINAEAI